jgi:phosphonopyruvate decarboxylase
MHIKDFMEVFDLFEVDFFTGVPDSLLGSFMDYIMMKYDVSLRHVVAANEGAAVGLAAGHYLATGTPAVVYMQNSGLGNATNPITSLLHRKVYGIPAIFVIGWRGEPSTKDEPQHVFQGEVTLPQLECLEIPYFIVSRDTTVTELSRRAEEFKEFIDKGQSVAFVICKSALDNEVKMTYTSKGKLSREQVLYKIIEHSNNNDVFVCTTGKLSREVFEIREQKQMGHGQDFLTVGAMGHSLMIAYGIALARPNKRVFCLDGDGAVLMHLGSLGIVGVANQKNLVHIVINNGAHETVGGIPTVATKIDFSEVATVLGYQHSYRIENEEVLLTLLNKLSKLDDGAVFIEIVCNLESRGDLGRPTTTPTQNKKDLMKFLSEDIG